MPGIYVQKSGPRGDYMELTGWEGTAGTAVIPSHVRDLPVTKIASHAFDGRTDLRELRLPDSVVSIGAFCFYNCRSLKKIHMYDSVEDFYDGALRQCLSLEEITIEFREKDHYSIVKEILADNDRMLTFHLVLPDGIQLRLTFPAYFDGFKEDTMARAIHHSINGSGFSYRECVMRKSISLKEYDRLFARVIYDSYEASVRIALDRLMYPVELAPVYAGNYERYLVETADQVLPYLIGRGDMERLLYLTEHKMIPSPVLEDAIRLASEKDQAETCAVLMEYQRKHFAAHAGTISFALDDLW